MRFEHDLFVAIHVDGEEQRNDFREHVTTMIAFNENHLPNCFKQICGEMNKDNLIKIVS